METINTTNRPAHSADGLRQAAGHQALTGEALEDRALLAADAAVARTGAAPPAEPAPYVAQEQQTPPVEINLGDALEGDAVGAVRTDSRAAPGGPQEGQLPAPRDAELHMESKLEGVEKRAPEAVDLGGGEVNRDEFGLATIEPEANSLEGLKSSRERGIVRELVLAGTENGGDHDARERAVGEATMTSSESVAVAAAVGEVSNELASVLGEQPASGEQAQSTSVGASVASIDKQPDAIVQAVLKSEPMTESVAPGISTHDAAAADAASDRRDQQPNAPAAGDDLSQERGLPQFDSTEIADAGAVEAPVKVSRAHDALFEGGRGVEAVLTPSEVAQKAK